MTIYLNTLKRIFNSKLNVLFMIIVPVIMITFAMFMSDEREALKVGFADYDKTPFTASIITGLEEKCYVVEMDERDFQQQLIGAKIDYALAIERGFTQDVIHGKDAQMKAYAIKETDTAIPVKMSMESYLNAAKKIARASENNSEKFYSGLKQYKNGNFTPVYKTIEENNNRKGNTLISIGFLVMNMLFLSNFASSMIMKDKEQKTYHRIFTTPVSIRSYMLQNTLSFLTVMFIQIAAIIAIMIFEFKADLGPSSFNLFIVLILFSFVCVSLGLAINSIARDRRQAGLIGTLLTTPMCMLGGCFWPRSLMPGVLQKVANFVPTTWVLKAAERVLYGDAFWEIYIEIGILIMFAMIFFLLSSWRKADIAK